MNNLSVRLKSLHIQNFKNVKNGFVDLRPGKSQSRASVLALYGQNGSGKTAFIEALFLFKKLASGSDLPEAFREQINVDADSAKFIFNFQIEDESENHCIYDVTYECKLSKKTAEELQNDWDGASSRQHRFTIRDEILSFGYRCKNEENKINKAKRIDTSTDEVFVPNEKYRRFVGSRKEIKAFLLASKKIAARNALSFIFSNDLSEVIRKNLQQSNKANIEAEKTLTVIQCLKRYAAQELFVVTIQESGLVNLNLLSLPFKHNLERSTIAGSITLSLNGTGLIEKPLVSIIERTFSGMNNVLNAIIPGLTISLKKLGEQLLENGKEGVIVEIISNKNNKPIALRYESEGIKKIISILYLLILVYNQKSITVAIDELDSGIFEYLLGEILKIISEKGNGQLIFTSHNLRPLETISHDSIVFTTTDPDNRYHRLLNVREANNLRDFYFRNIILGQGSPELYQTTHASEISLAFLEAGFENE